PIASSPAARWPCSGPMSRDVRSGRCWPFRSTSLGTAAFSATSTSRHRSLSSRWHRTRRRAPPRSGRLGEAMAVTNEEVFSAAFRPDQVINHTSGYLALSPRNRRFTIDGVPGFIAYREQGKHLISIGGIHAPAEHQEWLL